MKFEIAYGTMLKTNNILIGNEQEVVLIDVSASLETLVKKVAGRKVNAILLTHGHWDHYQTLDEVVKEFGCNCFLTVEAYQKIFTKAERTHFMKPIVSSLQKENFCLIEDNQILKFGNLEIKVLRTSGHTDCGVCYLVNPTVKPAQIDANLFVQVAEKKELDFEGSILLSGDTLFRGGQGRTDLPTGSQEQIEKSIVNLLKLPENLVVVPGHGMATTIALEKLNQLN